MKLTYEQVREIKARSDENPIALAAEYNVSKGTIYHIRAGRAWAYVN